MRSSVGFKLGVWLALLGILATGLMGLYAYTQSRQMLIDSSQDKLLTATRVLALRFSHSIAAVTSDVKFLAALPAVRSLGTGGSDIRQVSESRKHLEDVMSSVMRTHPEYFQVRLIGLADYGREIVRVDRTGDDIEVIRGNITVIRTNSEPACASSLT